MTQLLNQAIHLHPNTSHFTHYTISTIEGVATPALLFSSPFCPPSFPSHILLIPSFCLSLLHPLPKGCGIPTGESLLPGFLADPLYILSCPTLRSHAEPGLHAVAACELCCGDVCLLHQEDPAIIWCTLCIMLLQLPV